jgi:tetratricopeptide (TPR) repeat protein
MARRLGDTATLAHVLLDVHYSDSNVMTPDARLAAATEAIHLAHADGNTLLALRGRSLRLGDFLELGEIPKFRIETEAYARQVDHLRQARFRWHVPLLKATLATLEGQFDEAERLVERGIALGRQGEQEAALEMAPAVLCALRFAQGRAAELESFVREHVRHSTPLPAWRAVLAYVLFESGRDGEAAIEFELLATDGFGRIASDNLQLCSLALLSLTCAGLRDGRRAQLLYELVLPFADYVAHATPFGAGCLGSMAHYAGLLAATGGHWDAAVEHFERAIEVHAKLRAKAFLANSRFHLARALRARGNIAAAEDQLAKAESIARVLGIRLHLAGID